MGNRKYVYDGFMVSYMMRELIHFKDGQTSPGVYIPPIKRTVSYKHKDISSMDLFRAIRKNVYGRDVGIGPKRGYRTATYKTVRKRAEEMKKEHVLMKFPISSLSKTRRVDNKKPYKLHPDTLLAYVLFLLRLLTRGSMSESDIFMLIPKII